MLCGSSRRILSLAIALLALGAQAEPPGAAYQRIVGEARAARQRQDYPAYLALVRRLAELMPGHSASLYSLARGFSLSGDRVQAVATLGRLADAGFGYDAAADPAFEAHRGDPAFAAVAARLSANAAPHGAVGVTVPLGLQGQQPEGVAELGDGTFLVGTLRGSVYRVADAGTAALLADVGTTVVGIRPDPSSGTFLACISNQQTGRSSVQRRRIGDGSLVADHPFPAGNSFCNDVALVEDGFVATDSNNGLVYRLRGDRLEPLPIPPLLFPNGIASDPSGRRIFVANGNGILAVDLATGRAEPLVPHDALFGGIDGMVWHDGSLLVMQNVTVPARLVRVTPSPDGRARIETLLTGHPLLAGATTLTVHDGDAVILSQTGIPDGTQPDAPILLRVPLSR